LSNTQPSNDGVGSKSAAPIKLNTTLSLQLFPRAISTSLRIAHWLRLNRSATSCLSDFGVIKQMVGGDAKFLRFAGTDHLVIEVNGAEPTVTQEF
jgi:hypothetical protein